MVLNNLKYISDTAADIGVEPAALMAVIETESNGAVSTLVDGKPMPLIRWEGHYFYRLVPAKKRDQAVRAKLASPKAGAIKNPSSQEKRYEMLGRARAIDNDAALCSISVGIGQVMIAHWQDLGFVSPQAMFDHACTGFAGQADLIVRYLVFNKLVDEMQRHDWAGLARGYNGPNYARDGYHTKIGQAYERYAGQKAPVSPASGMLRLGSSGKRVRELQQLLVRAGYSIKVDGDFGPATRDAVKDIQRRTNLEADGVAGPATMAVLAKLRTEPEEASGTQIALDVPNVKEGLGGALGGATTVGLVNEAADKVSAVAGSSTTLSTLAAALTLIGVAITLGGLAWAAYGYWKSHRTYEGVS